MPDRFIGDATGVFAQLVEAAAPSTPASGYVRLYPKTDHKLYYQASTGGEKTVGTMDNPMTTAGDLIVGGSSGTPTRLAKGADGTFLKMVSGAQAYAALVIGDLPTTGQLYDLAAFVSGKPGAGANVLYVPVARGITVPASLSGSQGAGAVAATGSSVFTVNKIHSGSTTALGTFTFAGSGTVASLSGAGGALVAGDILQITAPGSQDATLADVGFTLKVTLT